MTVLVGDPPHRDHDLLQACRVYGRVASELDSLFHGRHRLRDEARRRQRHDELDERAWPLLRRISDLPATTTDGHAARAGAFVLFNAGELFQRATACGCMEDRLLAALLQDLVGARQTRSSFDTTSDDGDRGA